MKRINLFIAVLSCIEQNMSDMKKKERKIIVSDGEKKREKEKLKER